MSVAFRRESDEEHKEPRFELPVPVGRNLVTRRGLALIEDRVAALEAAVREATGEDSDRLRRDLRYWYTRRTTAQVTDAPPDGAAGFGTRVTYRLDGQERTIEIVGDDEGDPASGRIAWSAPLARALAGTDAGEAVDFNDRIDAIRVVSVESIER